MGLVSEFLKMFEISSMMVHQLGLWVVGRSDGLEIG